MADGDIIVFSERFWKKLPAEKDSAVRARAGARERWYL